MDWAASVVTLVAMELVARRRWEGWAVGLVAQGFWFWLILERELWGLLLVTIFLTWRYAVALIRWRREEATPRAAGLAESQ